MGISVDTLTTNESLPSKSRTFSPEVVARVHELLTGANGNAPVQNVGIGTFDKEGGARSALTSLNKLLKEQRGVQQPYAATVRATDDGKFKAILLNRPAKQKVAKEAAAPAAPKAAAAKS